MRLYTIYLPKSKGDTRNTVVEWLELYSKVTKSRNDIIVSPGYMSNTFKSVDDYLENLGIVLQQGTSRQIDIGFLNGMNGANYIRGTGVSVLDGHKTAISGHMPQSNLFNNIDLDVKHETDHRKVMTFFRRSSRFTSVINSSNYEDFLKTVTVNGVLLGSSNQSNTTYFASVAPKGEADVFMALGNAMADGNRSVIGFLEAISGDNNDMSQAIEGLTAEYSGLIENVTISEAFAGNNYDKPEEFLKDILRDLLKMGLN